MPTRVGDTLRGLGDNDTYRIVRGKDVDIKDADALSTGSDDDIILVDEDAQGLQSSTKKLSLSNLWNYILSKFTSTSSTTQVLYNQNNSIKGESDFVYDESNNKLTVTKLSSTEITGPLTGNVTGDVTGNLTGNVTGGVTGDVTGNVTGDLTGNVTGNVTGNLTGNVTGNVSGSSGSTTGNSSTATSLETARNIGGVSFDGTADIDLPGVNTQGNQDTTGNAATVTNIGNLTGDVTSTNRTTTIADNIIDEAKLKVSNAPINGYALTAQSGNTGGLTWAEISSGNVYTAGDGITLNNLEFDLDANLTTVITILNSLLVLGRDADNQIKFSTDNEITFRVGANDGVIFKTSGEIEATTFDGNVTGNLTGNVVGDVLGDVFGNANTVTNIGNLTGDVTSTNRATTIADNIIDEAKLRVSNAPVNNYVLTAQSGNTGGLTWQEPLTNLYRGITTSFIYIRANEFNVTSHTTFSMYTRDNVGSVQPTAYQNRGKVYATTFVPPTYEVTSVNIYASVNRNIRLLEGQTANDTITVIDTGTSNTTMTLTSAHQGVDGRYLVLEFEQGAASDEIYGGKIAIQSV